MSLPIKIKTLDIVIARACNLSCKGCVTFSNFSHIRGVLRWEDQRDKILPWLDRFEIETFITLFGGEPLMNPDIMQYLTGILDYYKQRGQKQNILIQTNGIRLLENLDIIRLGCETSSITIDVSVHSSHPNYKDKLRWGIAAANEIIEQEQVKNEDLKNFLSVTDYVGEEWVNHYLTDSDTGVIKPSRPYHSEDYDIPHSHCHIKDFVNLYDGRLYKCPPMATIGDYAANTPNFDTQQWHSWLEYKSCGPDDDVEAWMKQRNGPENVCNMCFPKQDQKQKIIHDADIKYFIPYDEVKFEKLKHDHTTNSDK